MKKGFLRRWRLASKKASPVGLWRWSSVLTAGAPLDPRTMGMEILLEIAEDGTSAMITNGVREPAAWTQDGANISFTGDAEDEKVVFRMHGDGTLRATLRGVQAVFTRVEDEPEEAGRTLFSLTLPENWAEVTPALIAQAAVDGDKATMKALGAIYAKAQEADILMYVNNTLRSQMGLTLRTADGMTTSSLLGRESTLAKAVPGFVFGDAVRFGGTEFLPAMSDDAGRVQYFTVASDICYVFTMVNVSDADAEVMLSSFAPA